jgi:hypothetical protein
MTRANKKRHRRHRAGGVSGVPPGQLAVIYMKVRDNVPCGGEFIQILEDPAKLKLWVLRHLWLDRRHEDAALREMGYHLKNLTSQVRADARLLIAERIAARLSTDEQVLDFAAQPN